MIARRTSRIVLTVHPAYGSNSVLGVCAHVRQGGWASIVPHSFFHVLVQQPDIVAIDIVDPVHSEAIGLVISDREPRSPMAAALLAAAIDARLDSSLSSL